MDVVADLQKLDAIAEANQAILDFIREIGGRIETDQQRAEYERLVNAYFNAVQTDTEPMAA